MPRGRGYGRGRRPRRRLSKPAMGKAKRRSTAGWTNGSGRGYRPMGTRGGYHQGKVASGRTNNKAHRQRRRRR